MFFTSNMPILSFNKYAMRFNSIFPVKKTQMLGNLQITTIVVIQKAGFEPFINHN